MHLAEAGFYSVSRMRAMTHAPIAKNDPSTIPHVLQSLSRPKSAAN